MKPHFPLCLGLISTSYLEDSACGFHVCFSKQLGGLETYFFFSLNVFYQKMKTILQYLPPAAGISIEKQKAT